jgi:hypothetical protein
MDENAREHSVKSKGLTSSRQRYFYGSPFNMSIQSKRFLIRKAYGGRPASPLLELIYLHGEIVNYCEIIGLPVRFVINQVTIHKLRKP